MPAKSFSVPMSLDAPRSDDPWNLRLYDVPWGNAYWKYSPGKLPGHDGDCLMLRSPTPIEQRRTAIACRHCRQRKAKCSGDQPACSRCAYSGRKCVYPDERRPQPSGKPSRPAKAPRKSHSDAFVRRDSALSSASSSTDCSVEEVHTKQEDNGDSEPFLLYDMATDQLQKWAPPYPTDSPRSDYSSPPSTAYYEVDYDPAGGQQLYYDYREPIASTSAAAPSSAAAIYAPRPVRPSAATPDLAYPHSEAGPQVSGEPAPYSYQAPPAQSVVHSAACAPASAGPISVAGPQQTFISIAESAELAAPSLAHSGAQCYASAPDAQPAAYYDAVDYGYATQSHYAAPTQMQDASQWYFDTRTGSWVVSDGAYAASYGAEQPGAMPVYAYGTAM